MSNTIPFCSSFGSGSVHFRYAKHAQHNENAQVLRAKQLPHHKVVHTVASARCPCEGRSAATIAAMMLNTNETTNARCKPERNSGMTDAK